MKKQEEVGMLIPNLRSEKGISFYSRDLISSINKKRNIKKIIYNRGNFISLLKTIPKLKKLKIIHIQHENRLFGIMDGIWFPPFIFILGILKRGKIILTFHSVHTKKEKLSSIHPLVTFIKRKFTHPLNYLFANLFCDLFVVHTKFLKEELIKNSKIKGEKIKVIPQGIKKIRKMDKKVCQKKLKMLGKNYLLIGNIGPNKGFDLILKQAEKISGKIFIVGSNDYGLKKEYLNYMKKLVKKKKIENKVKFVIKKKYQFKKFGVVGIFFCCRFGFTSLSGGGWKWNLCRCYGLKNTGNLQQPTFL